MNFNPCVVIPHYNHSDLLPGVIDNLQPFGLPIFVIDDGSSVEHRERVRAVCAKFPNVQIKEKEQNGGKGSAVMAGLHHTFEKGFSHAIQIDGDGQHDISALTRLIEKAKERPRDLVSGYPIYGEDIPKVRKFGRKITHFWVWIETLSFDIKDSMCGFRVYPLKECMSLFKSYSFSPRMEFDTEVMVKLHWSGIEFQHLPVKVCYPEEGRSHFRYVKDNVRLIWAHTKMVLGMMIRAPRWFILGRPKIDSEHWMTKPEAGSVFGLKLLLAIYTALGRRVLNVILYLVSAYYFVASSLARESSQEYLAKYRAYFGKDAVTGLSTYRHIYEFAISILDKFAVWKGDVTLGESEFPNKEVFFNLVDRKQGAVFLTSHFGNLEMCRAWARTFPDIKLNAVFYVRNAEKFNSILRTMSNDVNLNVYSPHEMGVETGILFKQKVEQGEWIFVMADRKLMGTQSRVVNSQFLGEDIELPMGPFSMADAMEAPVFAMHCFKLNGSYRVSVEPLAVQSELNRTERLESLARSYLGVLEGLVKIAPLQWFNFYHFWKKHE